jgi:hypothetical protein
MSRGVFRVVGLATLAAFLASGCATVPKKDKDLSAFQAEDPRSVLVVPVVNNTVEVTAGDYFLSTLTVPIAEHGYYVFPVDVVKHLLENDGLADAAMVHQADPMRLCSLFGADSVLYVTIERWDARYMLLTTQVTVAFDYTIKGCKTGDVLWNHQQTFLYSPQNQSTGNPVGDLIAMAITAAVTKAAPNYMPLARQANAMSFKYPDGPGFPPGPYRRNYRVGK